MLMKITEKSLMRLFSLPIIIRNCKLQPEPTLSFLRLVLTDTQLFVFSAKNSTASNLRCNRKELLKQHCHIIIFIPVFYPFRVMIYVQLFFLKSSVLPFFLNPVLIFLTRPRMSVMDFIRCICFFVSECMP